MTNIKRATVAIVAYTALVVGSAAFLSSDAEAQFSAEQHCSNLGLLAEAAAVERDSGTTLHTVTIEVATTVSRPLVADAITAVFQAFLSPDQPPKVVAGNVFVDCLTAYGE